MQRNAFPIPGYSWIETAIIAKWSLNEAWQYCVQVLDQRLKDQQLQVEEKIRIEEMYASFFHQAFYTGVKTKADVVLLIRNTRKMLSLLKKLDETTWAKFISGHM
jgi:hypothetical protein